MNIHLYTNKSDKIVVDKKLTQIAVLSNATLRDKCSIIDPVFMVDINAAGLTAADIADLNYCYIPDFERSYFINNITFDGHMIILEMHVDVLSTYRGNIRDLTAIISRQEHLYNLYLQDGLFKTYQKPHIQIVQFPGAFDTFQYIFSVSG